MADVLHDPNVLPDDLPAPQDDGAARHLVGMKLPDIALAATDGTEVRLSTLKGRTIVYVYPRTGRPGQALPTGWDAIPGARGCTPQSCGFRDHFAELKQLGVGALYGLSTQDIAYQREAAERLHLPFAILSDADLKLTRAMRLPTFTVDGMTLIKRMAWVIDDGVVVARVLSGISAGPERRRGDRLAQALAGFGEGFHPSHAVSCSAKPRRLSVPVDPRAEVESRPRGVVAIAVTAAPVRPVVRTIRPIIRVIAQVVGPIIRSVVGAVIRPVVAAVVARSP